MSTMDDDSISDHKLCGFLCVVLSLNPSPNTHVCKTLSSNTRLRIFGEGSEVGFKSEDGVVLSLINSNSNSNAKALASTGASSPDSGKGKSAEKESVSSRKRWKRIGVVHGSVSVVHQLQALVVNNCVDIIARVVRVAVGHCRGVRVVVLVDVYLPITLWSGWQFPKLGSIAAALFRHLSCDWGERRLMLVDNAEGRHEGSENIWNLFDCHVLGCKLRCSAPDISRRKLFELHEIFSSVHGGAKRESSSFSKVYPADASCRSGIWQLPEDVFINILNSLSPVDLVRISSTCRHLRSLAALIMPCMKLKLFPHQQVAVEWMLRRERDSEVLPHPLYMNIVTDDGFSFCVNMVSGEIVTGTIPTIRDFRGGLFCDEPGLGKTITALSLILKTQGTLPEPPDGVQVIWCMHNADQRCGYYELDGESAINQNARRRQLSFDKFTPGEILNCSQKRTKHMDCVEQTGQISDQCTVKELKSPTDACSTPATCVIRHARSLTHIKRNLLHTYEVSSGFSKERNEVASRFSKERMVRKNRSENNHVSNGRKRGSWDKRVSKSYGSQHSSNKSRNAAAEYAEYNETWVQCDACHKWRKLADTSTENITTAWFCSMNSDPLHQSCVVPEESWDCHHPITYLPGFHNKGTSGGKNENISFFTNVLREHYELINSETKKALTWLAKLSPVKLSEMETIGLVLHAGVPLGVASANDHEFHKIFQAFGLIKRVYRGATRWYYPKALEDLVFDLAALRAALCQPFDSFRLYLSRATLVIVPLNLVDHWKTQIQKHVRPGQLRVFIWTDHKKPCAHSLAWDYDIVITTFNRLSVEWSPHNRSVLMQVHWLRVMLDEGHTLGSSLNLTNKLQMAISLRASNRWLLTGTPTPNTPNSQLSHLQPMLKFLHEEAYGESQKSWEAGILRPFEAEMEEGRARLLQLLHRCMISARKVNLHTIPPCIKKVTFLNFTEEHARSYNELVLTVRRNILMADWNDPSHIESLLNPKQWKFRSNTTRNVRLSCCVAGHIKVEEAGQDIQETMDILVEGGLDPISEEYAFIKQNLRYGGNCMRCKEWCRLPVITPCRHLLCLNCASLDSERCVIPACGYLYEMQSPENLARPENPNPKWPVPKDLIELQPSYDQGDWHPDWHSTSSSKVTYLVQRLKELQEVNRKIVHPIHEGNDAKQIDELLFCSQKNDSITSLHHDICSRSSNESFKIPLEKVLIFSQFLEHINVIEQQLTGAGIKFAGLYSPLHSCRKMESLASFQHDASCIALLMDGSAALGLDLSFVTHVFLMEPIWDRSMEEQVISRAHRMGATRPIYVETLAMRGTVEEQMMKFLQNADECRRFLKEEFGKPDREGARAHRSLHDFAESNYLAKLSFVRTNSMT